MVIGAAGGKYIATALAQVHLIDLLMSNTLISPVSHELGLLPEISSKSSLMPGNLWDSLNYCGRAEG